MCAVVHFQTKNEDALQTLSSVSVVPPIPLHLHDREVLLPLTSIGIAVRWREWILHRVRAFRCEVGYSREGDCCESPFSFVLLATYIVCLFLSLLILFLAKY